MLDTRKILFIYLPLLSGQQWPSCKSLFSITLTDCFSLLTILSHDTSFQVFLPLFKILESPLFFKKKNR
jgi:hypothetical protein